MQSYFIRDCSFQKVFGDLQYSFQMGLGCVFIEMLKKMKKMKKVLLEFLE